MDKIQHTPSHDGVNIWDRARIACNYSIVVSEKFNKKGQRIETVS